MKRVFILKGLDCPNCSAKIEKEVGALPGVESSVVNLMQQTLTVQSEKSADATLAEQVETIVHSHEPDVEVSEKTEPAVTKVYLLKGLDCPNCSAKIEKEVGELGGVASSTVNLMNQTLTVQAGTSVAASLLDTVTTIVHSHEPDVEVSEKQPEATAPVKKEEKAAVYNDEDKKRTIRLAVGAAVYAIGMALTVFAKLPTPAELAFLIVAYVILGWDVVWQAVKNITRGQVFDEHFLMSVSTIGAFAIGEYPEAVAVMLFYQVGEFFQSLAVKRSRKSISDLMDIRPDSATVKRNGVLQVVSPESVAVGEIIVVKPGEKIPLDGIVVDGESMLDTKALTGESVPRSIRKGDEALSGCINQSGLLTLKVTKSFGESTVSKIIDLVENSNHPIAKSILAAYGKSIDQKQFSGFEEISGHGISVMVQGKKVLAGNSKLMESEKIAYSACDAAGTKVYVAADGSYVGCILIADEVKPDSNRAIAELKKIGVEKTVMLTGDDERIGKSVADELGLDAYYAQLLPDQKVEKLEMLDKQKRQGSKLAFVGDGINDAPVLARADVGIAMGGLGSDAAIEAADVVLMTDEPSKLVEAIDVAKATKRIVIDHFRGFDEYFSIPYGSETAVDGHWEKGPGIELFRAVEQALGKREIIAEDLGYMSDTVRQLVRDSGFPGMKVLEFAFDSRDTGSASDYLPHNYPVNSVAYTGTHDNETLVSWYQTISDAERAMVRDYLYDYATPDEQLYKSMIALILRSAAAKCIIPMQDWLGLDNAARINKPSTVGQNWRWRLKKTQLTKKLQKEICQLTTRYGRMNWA